MEKIIYTILMCLSIGIGLWEQTKPEKNVLLISACIIVFMYGMMKLSAKTPSKNKDNNENV